MPWPDWQKRHDSHRQPRRVDYTRPGFVRPADPECEACGVVLVDGLCWWCDDADGGGPDAA